MRRCFNDPHSSILNRCRRSLILKHNSRVQDTCPITSVASPCPAARTVRVTQAYKSERETVRALLPPQLGRPTQPATSCSPSHRAHAPRSRAALSGFLPREHEEAKRIPSNSHSSAAPFQKGAHSCLYPQHHLRSSCTWQVGMIFFRRHAFSPCSVVCHLFSGSKRCHPRFGKPSTVVGLKNRDWRLII